MSSPVIYKITSSSGRVYIGQSWNVKMRKATYASLHCKGQPTLFSSIAKHGWSQHTFEILHELPNDVSQEVLNTYELAYYTQYKECGCNMMNVREPNGSQGKLSESTKQKLKEATTAYYKNPVNRLKTSEATKKAMQRPEVKAKLGVAKIGIKLSQKHRKNISDGLKGRKATAVDYANFAKAHEAVRGRVQNQEEKDKRAKKLFKKVEVDGVVYESVGHCCKELNLNRSMAWRRLNSLKYPNWSYIK